MQNGRWAHKGSRIIIAGGFNWAEGGHPNAVPFYISTKGYGVFRNTWDEGWYDFGANDAASTGTFHNETRFDAFYFGGDMKEVLAGYIAIAGQPFMTPIYGLGLGDSDCYHNGRHGNSTQVVLAVAEEYRKQNMPGSWFLPNDGYGCGYGEDAETFPHNFTDLDFVVAELHKKGFYTGLWSSTGLPNIAREVKGSGVRIAKTDVGWIGAGYKYAFESVRFLSDSIENNSDHRRFIWTVEGWAGTHRYAVMWTGDDSGSFEYIKWQLPTFVGTGFSAQAHVSGDVDGIFGGSPDTYVRDLQFKCMMTTMMTMSGWAANPDKQPWTYGEPYASINRMYLKLKARLLPYFYTYSRVAYDTGVPPIRAMALEFPGEGNWTMTNWTGTAFQFMAGDSFLVAPVYEDAVVRSGIFLPTGLWYDYWTGQEYVGPMTLDNYSAPLDVLPMFVKAGAIIPMWPDMLYFNEKVVDEITFDIYPQGDTQFELYEDDGVTRQALGDGKAYAKTTISVTGGPPSPSGPDDVARNTMKEKPPVGNEPVNITVSASVGTYQGMVASRGYMMKVHFDKRAGPKDVYVAGKLVPKFESMPALNFAESGWFMMQDQANVGAATQRGTVYVKVPPQPVASEFVVSLSSGPSYPQVCLVQCDTILHHQVLPQVFDYTASSGLIVLKATGQCLTESSMDDPNSHTPAVAFEKCGSKDGNQKWKYSTTTLNLVSGATGKCMDQDGSDQRVEMYGCGHLQINQQWNVNANNTGHIETAGSKLCMSPCADSSAHAREAMMMQRRQTMQRNRIAAGMRNEL